MTHPGLYRNLTYLSHQKKHLGDNCMYQSLFAELKSYYSDHRAIYTDGSKAENRVAAAATSKNLSAQVRLPGNAIPLWVRGSRIGPTYPPACCKRRLIGGSLFAVGCDPCQWKRGSWLLSQFFVAALRRQYTALASISLSRKVKMAWLNQSAGSAKP